MALTTTKSILVTALLAAPSAEAFTSAVSMRDTNNMATTMVPQQRETVPGTNSSGSSRKIPFARDQMDDSRNGSTSVGSQQERHHQRRNSSRSRHRDPALAEYFYPTEESDLSDPTDLSLPSNPTSAGPLPESLKWASTNDTPWRKRAERGRVTVVAESTEKAEETVDDDTFSDGYETEDSSVEMDFPSVGSTGRRRALTRSEARAIRRQNSVRIRQENAAPIMDLVGVTAPLALIIGVSIVQSLP